MFFLFHLIILFSCNNKNEIDVDKEISTLKITGDSIIKDINQIRKRTEYLAEYTEGLYKKGIVSKNEVIVKSEFGSEYKSVDDGGSAVFISSIMPYDEEVKTVIYTTSNLDSLFKDVIDSLNILVKQVRYNERHSFMRVYPYVDVLAQLAPDLDLLTYRFYFCADDQHNPGRKNILISEPYVDPTGRGWIISSVSPVYFNYVFQGVIGLDITIDALRMKYIKGNSSDIMIIDSSGVCIAIDESKAGIFNMPVIKARKYLQTVNNEDYASDDINLLKSKDKKIRAAFESLIKEGSKSCELDLVNDRYRLFSYMIPELKWYVVKYEKI